MTAFERHRIVIDGDDWSMTTDPLRGFLDDLGYRPVMRSAGNLWGYRAEWTVRDGGLYLTHLDGEQSVEVEQPPTTDPPTGMPLPAAADRRTLVATELFGQELPVLAIWFSGSLHPERGLVEYVHAAWESRFAESRAVVVERGLVTELGPIDSTCPPPDPAAPAPRPSWWQRVLAR